MNAKQHIKNNKQVYITGGVCLIIGALGGIVIFRQTSVCNSKITQILSYKPHAHLEVHIEALGDPGNIIQDITTGTIYASQGQAARELGLQGARISEQLLGKRDHVNGHIFEKLGKAVVPSE